MFKGKLKSSHSTKIISWNGAKLCSFFLIIFFVIYKILQSCSTSIPLVKRSSKTDMTSLYKPFSM